MSYAAVKTKNIPFAIEALQVLLGSFALAVGAQVAVYLPWSPVPISAQTLVLALMAGLLGPRRAVLSVVAYLVEGIGGLPVFAGGAGGLMAFCSPARLGYLLGFIPQVWLIGTFWHSGARSSLWKAFAAHLSASLVLFSCGVAVLGFVIGYQEAVLVGVLPFLMGDLAKTLLAISLLKYNK